MLWGSGFVVVFNLFYISRPNHCYWEQEDSQMFCFKLNEGEKLSA